MFRRFDIRRGEGNGENEMSRTIISLPNELECCSAYNILLPGYQMILNLKWEMHSQIFGEMAGQSSYVFNSAVA